MNNSCFFVTSSGTDVGKTLITCALSWQLHQKGKKTQALKPVVTGFSENDPSSDTALILNSLGLDVTPEAINQISPWRFHAALSPHMAAVGNNRLDIHEIADYCHKQHAKVDTLLVEGIGGVMTPLNAHETVLDLITILNWPVLFVAGSYLGSISHSLTALQILRSNHVPIAGIILSESKDSPVPLLQTAQTLQRFTGDPIPVTTIPRLPAHPRLYTTLPNLLPLVDINS